MGRAKKRGEAGAAKNFITRNQAIRKLQISLADFRRLCIFKAIYPREPRSKKRANKGSSAPATFYYTKDIQYLLHEPVLQRFRDHKVFAKKLNRFIGRQEWSAAKNLEEARPTYTLDHLVKERYPTFLDALRDLDDALSMLFLFSQMSTGDHIPVKTIDKCTRLCAEWQHYIIQSHTLQKVFISIKGVYYRAEIKGQTVTWLVPHKFAQHVPSDVDFRIMLTFLEFYQTFAGFVNFKLYTEVGLLYPPSFDSALDEEGAGMWAYQVRKTSEVPKVDFKGRDTSTQAKTLPLKLASLSAQEDEAAVAEVVEEATDTIDTFTPALPDTSDVLPTVHDTSTARNIFHGLRFFVSREVPLSLLAMPILAFGGELSWDPILGAGSPLEESDSSISHQIVDRPELAQRYANRVYVVPQWAADCINEGKLLSAKDYAPGILCPPHLSPFVDYAAEEAFEEEEEEEAEADYEVQAPESDNEHREELEAEAAGVYTAKEPGKPKKKKKSKAKAQQVEKEEEVEMRKMMMSRRKRKLYDKMQYSNRQKQLKADVLRKRRATSAVGK